MFKGRDVEGLRNREKDGEFVNKKLRFIVLLQNGLEIAV
jgi:hypothetical protein